MKKLALFVGFIILFFTLSLFLPYEKAFVALTLFVEEHRALARLLYFGVYVVAVVFIIPGSILTLLGGFLFGVVEGFVLVSVSSVVGACIAFLIGRYLARQWVEERTRRFDTWIKFDQAIALRGFYVVLLTRLSPIFPFNLLNYFLGLTKIRFTHYLFASWLGMAPATLLYVYLGSIALSTADVLMGSTTNSSWQNALLVVGLAATAGLVVVLARLASSILKNEIEGKTE